MAVSLLGKISIDTVFDGAQDCSCLTIVIVNRWLTVLGDVVVSRKWGVDPFLCIADNVLGLEGCAVVGEDAVVQRTANGRLIAELAEIVAAITPECLHAGIGIDERTGRELAL